jgi:tetratricopeptide (TPR) repeat protein
MHLRLPLTILVAGTLFLATSSPSFAQTDPTETAKIHYAAGEQHYLRGRYKEAIAEFEEAYRLTSAPALLYNISQAYEKLGDLPKAREYLQSYLDTNHPEPAERPQLEDKLRILDERIREANTSKPLPPPKRPFKIAKWVVLGSGVLLVGLSGFFMLDSASASSEIEDAQGGEFDSGLQDTYDRGERSELLAWSFGIAGTAVIAVGVVFVVLDARAAKEHERIRSRQFSFTPVIGPDVAGAAFSWTF